MFGGSGGTPGATATGGGSGSGIATPKGSGDAGGIIGAAWGVGSGLFKLGGAYAGQVGDAAGGMIGAINNAVPLAIPGLPQCVTNPMANDICAIYYILDWTLFAPGTAGALIIPLVLILMNFIIIVKFLRWGWRIIGRGEDMANAGSS